MKIEQPGQYRGTIKEFGISETSEKSGKKPQVVVMFDVMVFPSGYTHEHYDKTVEAGDVPPAFETVEMSWYGSLNEGQARQITFDAVMKMGLVKGQFGKIAEGSAGGALTVGKVMGLNVKENDYEGKVTLQIRGIYVPGEAFGARRLEQGDALKSLSTMATLEGDFAKRQAASLGSGPVSAPSPATKPAPAKTATGGKKPGF